MPKKKSKAKAKKTIEPRAFNNHQEGAEARNRFRTPSYCLLFCVVCEKRLTRGIIFYNGKHYCPDCLK